MQALQDGDADGKLDVSSTTRSYELTDSTVSRRYAADTASAFPFASASSLNSILFSSSDSYTLRAAGGALPPLQPDDGLQDMNTTVIIYEDADEAAASDAEAAQPSSQVSVAFPTWDSELDYHGDNQHISVTSTGFIPVSIAYSVTGAAQPQQQPAAPTAGSAVSSNSSSSSDSGLSSTLRSPPPLPELPSPSSPQAQQPPAAPVPISAARMSPVSFLNRFTPSPPPPPPRPSESAVAEEQRRALQPPARHSPGLPPLPPSALSATRRTPPSPLNPQPLEPQHAVNGGSATATAAVSALSSSSSSSLLSSSYASGRRGGGSLRTASFDVLRYLQSDLHRGELCWLWAGDRRPLERRRQFVFWEPPDDADAAGRQQLGSLHWCDAAVLGQQQQRLLLPERQFLLHDVSDVYVSNLSGCPYSPFFLSSGQPAAGVSLPCCVSVLVSESFGFHLQLDSVAQREAWVMEFLALLHERKYITETASLPFAPAATGTASAPLTPKSGSHTASQGQDSDSGSSAPPSVTSPASGSVLYSGVPVSEQPLIASDSIICECASRALLVSAGDVVVQMEDTDGVFQTRRIQPLPADGSLLTAMCCHSSCLFQCRRHPNGGRNELIAIPIAADEWRPEALSSVDIGPTAGSHCACSSDGRLVYIAAGNAVLRVADMQRVERLELPQPSRSDSAVELGNLALSSDDSALFCLDLADPSDGLWWWNVSTGQCRKLLLAAVASSPRSIAFVAGTCHLLLVNADVRVQLLDLTAVIRSPTAATPTLRRIPLDMADVRHCMIGGFSLLSAVEAASGAYTAEDRKRPVLIARAVDSTQGLTTFILPLRGALGIRRWQLVADRRSGGGGSSSNLAASLSSKRSASTSPRHANGSATAAAPFRLPRLVLGSSCRLKQLETCRVFCSFVDPSIHFLLLYSHKKRCLYAFNCRTEQLHKMVERVQEEVCALCYDPARERLYVCWPSRLSHFSIRKSDWAELVERKTMQLSGGTTLAHLTARPVSCICDRAGEFVYVSLSVRVVRVSAGGGGIKQDFSALGSLVCDPCMTDLALSHGDRQLLALDSATRRVWRWQISSGQCLNRLSDRAYLAMERSESSPPACRLSVAHPNSSLILLTDTAAQLRVFLAPPFDPSQPQQCSELMRFSLLTSVEPSSRSWRLTSPFSSSAADEDGRGGSQALTAPDAVFARTMRDESISVLAIQSGLRLISQFRREEQQPA